MSDTEPLASLRIGQLTVAYRWVRNITVSPLLFLHGLGDSSVITFDHIARHPMLSGCAALLIDLPGFGYSSAPNSWPATMEDHADAVTTALEVLGIRSASIVGHSMGGSLALLIASRRPDLVARLILAEPLLRREDSELGRTIARREEEDFVNRGYGMLQVATRRQAARGSAAAEGFRAPLELAQPAILHRTAVSLLANRVPTFLEILEQLACPRTLLVGERTAITTGVVASDVEEVRIPDAGHSMMSENPGGFVAAIAGVLGDRDGAMVDRSPESGDG